MLGLKLNHVSKKGYRASILSLSTNTSCIRYHEACMPRTKCIGFNRPGHILLTIDTCFKDCQSSLLCFAVSRMRTVSRSSLFRTLQSGTTSHVTSLEDTSAKRIKVCCREHAQTLSWWRHQMEIFSALLALCARNSSVTDEVPSQRPVTCSFGIFFDLRLNKCLNIQTRRWWFETPSRPLWSHCNVHVVLFYFVLKHESTFPRAMTLGL